MAADDFMPDPTIAQTDPERSEDNDRFPEVARKKMRAVCTVRARRWQRFILEPILYRTAPPAANFIPAQATT